MVLLQSGKNIFRSLKCVITLTLPTFYPFAPLFELIIASTRHALLALIYFQNSNDGGKSTKCERESEELPFLSSIDIICGLYMLGGTSFRGIIKNFNDWCKNPFNPIPTGGALLGPNDLKQSGISTVLWLESPKFMTLFISVPIWSH